MRNRATCLPEELANNFASAERKDGWVASLLAVVGPVLTVCAIFLPFLAVERLWSTPGPVRGLFLLLGLAGIAWFVGKWAAHRVARLRDPFATIRRIERHYPDLGDSLRSVVELAEDNGSQKGTSESLRMAAVRQVASRCHGRDFRQAISTSRLALYARRAVVVLLLLLVAGMMEPDVLRNSLARFLRPWAAIPRYTFAQLDSLPASIRVPRGEPFSVPVRLAKGSRWQPQSLRYRLGNGDAKSVLLAGGEAAIELPGTTEPARLSIRLGDTGAAIRIEPVSRPALLGLVADVSLPAYLQHADETVECARERPRLVEGSTLRLRGTVLNPVAAAWLVAGDDVTDLQARGPGFVSPPLPATALMKGTLHWRDSNGLLPPDPYAVEADIIPDAPPTTQLDATCRVAAILEQEVLALRPRAADDFGIKDVEVAWDVFSAESPEDKPRDSGRRRIADGAPGLTEWQGEFEFSPQRLHIPPGSCVILRSRAVDYKPGRSPAESPEIKVYVLTPEEHARLVQGQLEALRTRIEEAALREAQQLFDNEQLAKLTSEELKADEAQHKLEKQADLEQKSVEDWQRLTEEAAKLLAEATRNDTFPVDALKEWTEIMEAVHSVSSEMLPEASASLAQASQAQAQRQENLQKAIEAQRKALEALKKAAQEMGESLEKFAVLNMAARLRAIADREQRMSGALQELFPQTIGMTGSKLPPLLANRVGGLTADQTTIQKLAFSLQFEIKRFLENTGIEKYGKVADAMEEAKLDEEMPKAVAAIADNRLAQATGEVQRWAKAFEEWAKILDDKKDGGGGGGGGGGEMSKEAIEFMLALMRAIQSQSQVLHDTRGLDAEREQIKDYPQQAERLAVAEGQLSMTVGELAKKLPPSEVRVTIEDAAGIMEDVGIALREPRTNREVQADMTTAIEMLASLFESNGGGQGQSNAMMAMMAQKLGLQMAMGAAAGASGGGSRAGGPFGGAGGQVTGGAGSGGSAARGGNSVTDVAPPDFPAEYRVLLERFFKEVEAGNE